MRHIAIQSGHWNTTNGQTGAPRELERTLAIGQRLVEKLNGNGFYAVQCDALANVNPTITGQDWDLFLALHCDMDYPGTEGGGFIDYPDPSVDYSSAESKRIKEVIEGVYFTESGIRNVPARSNPNTKFYYMWSALSSKTPCNILEMGESIDPHDNVILNDTDRQANILLSAIKKAFPDAVVVNPCQTYIDEVSKRDRVIGERDASIVTLNREIVDLKNKLANIPPCPPCPPATDCSSYINQINYVKSVLYGKGFWWTKINNLKAMFPK